MQQPDREDIWLTNLKFTRQWQAEEVEDVVESKGGSEKYPGPALFPGLAATSKGFAQPDTNNSNPYDRLAADKPGEELTSDSTIWKLYVNEAKEYDEELVLAKNRNLDMMLVFAALFSAILTSFLLDSKNMMQPDAADTSNQLLARIAQRLENPNAPLAPADTSTFSPSSSARWINGLWFTSLVFSLSAALIAMLAKEWLDTFVTSRPRPAHAFALKRQARLDALYSWGALHIIDYLPLFLHIALLMFSLGLVVYLYTAIDTTVATIVALTTGATAFFYVITNLLSVLYEVSPFGTQISLSTRRILRFAANHWSYAQRWKHYFTIKQSKSSDKTTEEDLHALRWLANHAQDPLVGDSAYHALAGFRLGSSPATVDATPDPTIPTSQDEALAKLGRKEKLITNMFVDVCLRLGEATSAGAHELEVSCGASVARYAATLPPLVNYLQPHRNRDLLVKLADARRRQLDAEEERFDPPKQALSALDCILDNNCPPFTADAYALITASELRLVTDIAGSLESTRNSRLRSESDGKSLHARRTSTAAETLISVTIGIDPKHNSEVNIFGLRARYSRSLARASFQMFFHSTDRAPMSAFSLISLLKSLEAAAKCEELNQITRDGLDPQERPLSTHHPQSPGLSLKLPDFNIFLVGAGDSYELRSGDIGDPCGLIAGILDILGASGARNVPGVESAAANALNSVAPMLIRQLLGPSTTFSIPATSPTERRTGSVAMRDRPNRASQYSADWVPTTPSGDPEIAPQSPVMTGSPPLSPHTPRAPFLSFINARDWPAHDKNLSIAHWSLGQMIVLAAFARSRQEELGIGELSRLSIRAFDHRFQSCFPRSTAFTIAETYSGQLNYLIDNPDPVEPGSTDADSAHTHLVQILALKEDKTVYSILMGDEPDGPSRLLRIMQSAYAPPATIETLLADISDSADRHWAYFTDASTGGDQGLAQLLKLGERHVYKPGVARCIFKITRTAAAITAERRISPVISPNAFGIFFEAMRFVLNHYASDPKKPLDPYIFVDNMFKVVRAFDRTQDELVSKHIPRKEVKAFLKTISKNTPLKGRVQKDLERFKDLDPPKTAGGSKHPADQELEGGTESQVKPENPDE